MYWGQDFKQGDGVREVGNEAEEALLREHHLHFASVLAYWRDLHFSDEKKKGRKYMLEMYDFTAAACIRKSQLSV